MDLHIKAVLTGLSVTQESAAQDPTLFDLRPVAQALLDAGADINRLDGGGMSPLERFINGCLQHRDTHVAPRASQGSVKARTAICNFARRSHRWEDFAIWLVEHGAKLHVAYEGGGYRTLDHVAGLGWSACMRVMIAHGADPSPIPIRAEVLGNLAGSVDVSSGHYIEYAVHNDFVDILRVAHEVGVKLLELRSIFATNLSMLHLAAQSQSRNCVAFLLELGANVNEIGRIGDAKRGTPLDVANTVAALQIKAMLVAAGGKTYAELQRKR